VLASDKVAKIGQPLLRLQLHLNAAASTASSSSAVAADATSDVPSTEIALELSKDELDTLIAQLEAAKGVSPEAPIQRRGDTPRMSQSSGAGRGGAPPRHTAVRSAVRTRCLPRDTLELALTPLSRSKKMYCYLCHVCCSQGESLVTRKRSSLAWEGVSLVPLMYSDASLSRGAGRKPGALCMHAGGLSPVLSHSFCMPTSLKPGACYYVHAESSPSLPL
jgi:hypothetical protein